MGCKGFKPVRVRVPARVHLGLISMHERGYRHAGGVGFSLDFDAIEVRSARWGQEDILDLRCSALDVAELAALQRWYSRVVLGLKINYGFGVDILPGVASHIGLGTGTALRLAILDLLNYEHSLGLTEERMGHLSARGGVSGIGLNTYFRGGFVLDLGRKNRGENMKSSDDFEEVVGSPLVSFQGKMPDWLFGLCLPKTMKTTLVAERELFKRTKEFNQSDTEYSLYHSILGAQAAVQECSIDDFCCAVDMLQRSKWKQLEWSIQSPKVHALRDSIIREGARFAALSSMGPAIVLFADNIHKVVEKISEKFSDDFDFVIASPSDSGRLIVE